MKNVEMHSEKEAQMFVISSTVGVGLNMFTNPFRTTRSFLKAARTGTDVPQASKHQDLKP